ncbi:MAG TPA: hypothetical protein VM146_05420 [Steroidobacteraceae bacterium]|nr:hypothetical protein [Steroidobacteraceae bacterium]
MPRRLLYLLVLLALAAALLFMRLPIPPTFAGRTIENAGHMPLFFLITMGFLLVLRDYSLFKSGPVESGRFAGGWLYLVAALVGMGGGFLTEVMQKPMHRDASWDDVFADAVGALCAVSLYVLFDRRTTLQRWHRLLAAVVAVTCIAIYLSPIVSMGRAYLHRNSQFPVLADFHSRLELYWAVGIGARRDIVDDHLVVEYVSDDFPGLSFHEPVADWRAYQTLVIDVGNPGAEPFDLGLRIHDKKHNRRFADRFNRHFMLAAGERKALRIGLDEIRRGPRTRLMDMQQISDITLFRGKPEGSRQLVVYAMRLE